MSLSGLCTLTKGCTKGNTGNNPTHCSCFSLRKIKEKQVKTQCTKVSKISVLPVVLLGSE